MLAKARVDAITVSYTGHTCVPMHTPSCLCMHMVTCMSVSEIVMISSRIQTCRGTAGLVRLPKAALPCLLTSMFLQKVALVPNRIWHCSLAL